MGKAGRQLVSLRLKAVPHLIAALDDETLTHFSADQERMLFEDFVQPLLRVGDVAAILIGHIAAKSIHPRPNFSVYTPIKIRNREEKAQILAWWRTVQSNGEHKALIDGILKGDLSSAVAFQRLAKTHPDEAVATLRKVFEANPHPAPTLPDMLAYAKTESSRKFGRELLDHSDYWVKLNAATVVLDYDPELVAKKLGALWQQTPDSDSSKSSMLDTLIQTRSPVAIEALQRDFSKRTDRTRGEVLDALQYRLTFLPQEIAKKRRPSDGAFLHATEKLLLGSLSDKALRPWAGPLGFARSGRDEQFLAEPRNSDVAALALYRLDPKRYPFKIHPTKAEMDKMENAWAARSKQGF
jgi:hypothetical protein